MKYTSIISAIKEEVLMEEHSITSEEIQADKDAHPDEYLAGGMEADFAWEILAERFTDAHPDHEVISIEEKTDEKA